MICVDICQVCDLDLFEIVLDIFNLVLYLWERIISVFVVIIIVIYFTFAICYLVIKLGMLGYCILFVIDMCLINIINFNSTINNNINDIKWRYMRDLDFSLEIDH